MMHVMLQEVDAGGFETEVLNYQGVVLVDFYADWCGPCRMLMPILCEMSEEQPDVKFVKINTDHNQDLAKQQNICNLPTLLLFNSGKLVARNIGSATKLEIEDLIRSAIEAGSRVA